MIALSKLSDAQRALLFRAVERGEDGARLNGRGEHASYYVLSRHALVGPISRFCGGSFVVATADGIALVDAARCAACGHYEYHCPASGCNHCDAAPPDPFGDADENEATHLYCDCEEFVPRESLPSGEVKGSKP